MLTKLNATTIGTPSPLGILPNALTEMMAMENNSQVITVRINPPLDGLPSSFKVSFITAIEMLYIMQLGKWENTAPLPGKFGWFNGIHLENSQQARLQYLLKNIGINNAEKTYSALAVKTRKSGDGGSMITTHKPAQGLPLLGGWYLDCCLNIGQKLEIVGSLRHLGYSRDFIEISKGFVIGKSISEVQQRQQKRQMACHRNGAKT
jgi:hypothetical protein